MILESVRPTKARKITLANSIICLALMPRYRQQMHNRFYFDTAKVNKPIDCKKKILGRGKVGQQT